MAIELGRTIRILRQAKNMKLSELAKKSQVSISFMSLLESGEREPSLEVIRRIAAAIGIPSEALVLLGMGAGSTLRSPDPETAAITRAIDNLTKVECELKQLLGTKEPQEQHERDSDAPRKRNHAGRRRQSDRKERK